MNICIGKAITQIKKQKFYANFTQITNHTSI